MHIGELVRARAKELKIGSTELAKRINTSKQNVYGIYKRDSIDTQLLDKLCKALDYDFFKHFSGANSGKLMLTYPEYQDNESQLLARQLQDVEEKYELLKALYEKETGKKLPFSK